jgi:hypothetical protein
MNYNRAINKESHERLAVSLRYVSSAKNKAYITSFSFSIGLFVVPEVALPPPPAAALAPAANTK